MKIKQTVSKKKGAFSIEDARPERVNSPLLSTEILNVVTVTD